MPPLLPSSSFSPSPSSLLSPLWFAVIIIILMCCCINPSSAHDLRATNPHPECGTWSYFGHTGPSHWGELCPFFAGCSSGQHQSPVNVDPARIVIDPTLSPIYFDYLDMEELNVTGEGADQIGVHQLFENNGHTVELVWRPKGDSISSGPFEEGKTFHLAQFHFHSPSENFFHGLEHPLEIHLVHATPDGEIAVVAVFFEIQDVGHDDFLRNLATNLPSAHEEVIVESPDLKKFVEDAFRDGYYYFEGSLTTPPCTEGVHWIVARRVLAATEEEIDDFELTLVDNHRPKQPLNDRVIRQFVPYERNTIPALTFTLAVLAGVVFLAAVIATVLYCKLVRHLN